MSKQLIFNESEQKIITDSIMSINSILLLKMDEGVISPELDGVMSVDNEDKEVVFSFIAKRKSSKKTK